MHPCHLPEDLTPTLTLTKARIRDICLKTLISVEHSVVSKQLQMCPHPLTLTLS